jgi:prophage antirepressor-like protein
MAITGIFEFGGKKIRTAGTPDTPLFCAADVCGVLGLDNVGMAVSRLRDEEKRLITSADVSKKSGKSGNLVPGARGSVYVTEPGLYKIIFSSRKAEAEAFQDWVTGEVLPEIRRRGAYSLVEALERKRIREECFLLLPERQAPMFNDLIDALRKFARSSDGGTGGTPPWARLIAQWIYEWTWKSHKGVLRELNKKRSDGSLIWRDYEGLTPEGRQRVEITIANAAFAANLDSTADWAHWRQIMEAHYNGAPVQNWLPFTTQSKALPSHKGRDK